METAWWYVLASMNVGGAGISQVHRWSVGECQMVPPSPHKARQHNRGFSDTHMTEEEAQMKQDNQLLANQ